MNILHLSTEMGWRGGENQLLLLLNGIDKTQTKHFVAANLESAISKRLSTPVEFVPMRFDSGFNFFTAFKIAKFVKINEIDIIHAHTSIGHTFALVAYVIFKLIYKKNPPKIIVHRRVIQEKRLWGFRKWKYQSSYIDTYVCVSHAVANSLKGVGVPTSKTVVIHSAIDAESVTQSPEIRRTIRESLKIPQNAFVACYVGSIEAQKGVTFLLDAWCQLMENTNSAAAPHLIFVGDGELFNGLKAIIEEKHLNSVRLVGFQKNTYSFLIASDVLVLPTLWEGLGTVLLEGALAGCALIGTSIGGVPEIIKDHETGLLVPAQSHVSIHDALNLLLQDQTLRNRLVKQAQAHIKKNFSTENLITLMQQTYRKVAGHS